MEKHQKDKILDKALKDLENVQEQLLETEKIAALGRLVAGVAHEINNPLCVIRSSIENITDSLDKTLMELPVFFESISKDRREDFLKLLDISIKKNISISSREERKIRKGLMKELEKTIDQADITADILVDMGIYKHEPFMDMILDPQCDYILDMAYKLSGLQRSAQNIKIAVERAATVVFALKSYSHFNYSDKMVKTNIIEGIETVLTLYDNQLKQGIEVVRNYKNVPSVMCYPDELNQVWTNFIHNALYAMDNNGKLIIDVYEKQECVKIAITDSGRGISDEIKNKIFDPFFTTKPKGEGSGIGLDIVKQIIDKHEGKIVVSSIPGETTFCVILPIHK